MSTYGQRLATELRNRYEDHDRMGFDAALERMVRAIDGPSPMPLSAKTGKQCTQACAGVCVLSLVGREQETHR